MFSILTNATLLDVFELAAFTTEQEAIAYAHRIAPLLRPGIPGNEEVSQSIHVTDPDGRDVLVINL